MMKANFTKTFILLLFVSALFSCSNDSSDTDASLPEVSVGIAPPAAINYNIINQFPHDTSAYTQGLILYKGILYESTGDYENSSLRITDKTSGNVIKKHIMGSDKIFGEGITILNDTIYQLTWMNNIVYVYLLSDISHPVKTFNWPYQGWGITNNGKDLIISDGSANLYFVRPSDFKVLASIQVVDNDGPVRFLNELEFVNGSVYSNVYETDRIVKIDPESGHVTGEIRLPNLLSKNEINDRTDVLNGIAYDSTTNSLLITGKRWPKLFELKLN